MPRVRGFQTISQLNLAAALAEAQRLFMNIDQRGKPTDRT